MSLSPNHFYPKPKINSSILEFNFKKKIKNVCNEEAFIKLIRNCFNQRRKTIKNNLKKKIKLIDEALLNCKINAKKRPEELDFNDYVNLSNYLYK